MWDDVRNFNNWKHLLEEVEYVFHLADIQVAHSALEPVEDLDVNAKSVLEILQYIKNELRNIQRFVYIIMFNIWLPY